MSKRRILLTVLGPLLGTAILTLFAFRMAVLATRMGIPPRSRMWIGVLCPLAHALSAWVAGRWVTARRATAVLLGGLVAMAAAGTVSLPADSFPLYLAVSFCLGLGTGHYFLSLQLVAGHSRPCRTLARALAILMIGMGLGEGLGPVLCGYIGPQAVILLAVVAWAFVALHWGAILLAGPIPKTHTDAEPVHEITSTPVLRTVSRICAVSSMVLFCGMLSVLWPGLGVRRGYTDADISLGTGIAGLMGPVGLVIWACLKRWMTRPWLLLSLAGVNALAFVGLVMAQSFFLELTTLALIGLAWSGQIYHCMYYGNAAAANVPRHVGINEACFGLGALTGPALMGLLAWDNAASPLPYRIGGILMLLAVAVCAILWTRNPQHATDNSQGDGPLTEA